MDCAGDKCNAVTARNLIRTHIMNAELLSCLSSIMILSAVSAAELSTKLREVFTVPRDTFTFKESNKVKTLC